MVCLKIYCLMITIQLARTKTDILVLQLFVLNTSFAISILDWINFQRMDWLLY